MLKEFPSNKNPKVLYGVNAADDAGVYLLREDLALVQTLDFFTPIVDDPYDFGRIAAANALSDIWAMGAEAITAMNIITFPEQGEPGLEVLAQILKGGFDIAQQAGVVILGGHSVDDKEPKYGMAVTGTVHPNKIWGKDGALPGDKIILTKPLGTGIIATAIKKANPSKEAVALLTKTACTLNKYAADAARKVTVHAATDVTGFGLVNHALEICRASVVGMEINISMLPVLNHVTDLIAQGHVPGGTKKNLTFAQDRLVIDDGVTQTQQIIAADAQTSGGLLLAVPSDQAKELSARLKDAGTPAWAIIGTVIESKTPVLKLHP